MITGRAPVHERSRTATSSQRDVRNPAFSNNRKNFCDAAKRRAQIERRLFLKQGLSLGALTLLTGCDVTDQSAVQNVLNGISRWNDRVQAALFNPSGRLMPTYPESAAVKDFRFNAYFGADQAPKIDGSAFKLGLSGLIDNRRPWTLEQLYALPQESQVTRHVCVEGWSMIGKWTGVPFRTFLQRIGADLTAKYVGFECADGYYSSIDMASALHPQTFLTFKISDEVLAPKFGYPLKLRIPTKLGFKNPKWIVAMYITNRFPGVLGRPGLQLVRRGLNPDCRIALLMVSVAIPRRLWRHRFMAVALRRPVRSVRPAHCLRCPRGLGAAATSRR